MLLKNNLHHWISTKNHSKKNDRPQGALPLGRKGRCGFSVYAATVLCVGCLSFAASDPLTVVNNLSTFIFSLIRAIGLILLGWGVVQVGLSFQSHDPSQRSQGFLTLAGGLVVTFAKEILDLITACVSVFRRRGRPQGRSRLFFLKEVTRRQLDHR